MKPSGQRQSLKSGLRKDIVVHGEDAKEFDAFFAHVNAEIRPRDLIERIWSRIIAIWSGRSSVKAREIQFLISKLPPGRGAYYLHTRPPGNRPEGTVDPKGIAENNDAVIDVNEAPECGGRDDSTVIAEVLFARLDKIECIDRLMAAAEMRRDRMVRDLEKRRGTIELPLAGLIDQSKKAP